MNMIGFRFEPQKSCYYIDFHERPEKYAHKVIYCLAY